MSSLTPERLLFGYARGIFPMAYEGEIYWYDPDLRAILPFDRFHVSRTLRRTMKWVRVRDDLVAAGAESRYFVQGKVVRRAPKDEFLVTVDEDFEGVITACADPTRPGAWIDERIITGYTALHEAGFAHRVEVWQHGRVVGGLYGVALNGLFAGEAMFSHVNNASKIALVYLVDRLQRGGFTLLDVQFQTPHLAQFGVTEIPRILYRQRLIEAMHVEATW